MKRVGAVLLAAMLIGGFAYGLLRLFQFRFSTGDAYPKYSSLRTDPAGAKVLFESLARLPGMRVARNLMPLASMTQTGSTVFLLGVAPNLSAGEGTLYLHSLERLAARGNRVVLALREVEEGEKANVDALQQAWGVRMERGAFSSGKEWKPLDPRALERAFGKGTIVLMADATMFTNVSLAAGGDPELLARIIGPHRDIVFDETHLGITESGSVVALARRFRLHGVFFGLALCTALFIWRSTASFPPLPPAPSSSGVSGRTALAGLITLLQRHVRKTELVDQCWRQWLKGGAILLPPDRRTAIEAIVHDGSKEPVAAIREIQTVLSAKGAG
jgi:hypothetical protein